MNLRFFVNEWRKAAKENEWEPKRVNVMAYKLVEEDDCSVEGVMVNLSRDVKQGCQLFWFLWKLPEFEAHFKHLRIFGQNIPSSVHIWHFYGKTAQSWLTHLLAYLFILFSHSYSPELFVLCLLL